MHPYKSLPSKSFWKLAVSNRNCLDIAGLWNPKFNIMAEDKISTYGSCFAQHIGRSLKSRGYNWLDTETAPSGLSEDDCNKYSYKVFSSRTGNIYTTSLLRQWILTSSGTKEAPKEFWIKNSRYFDVLRPNVEPEGFISYEELESSRNQTLKSFLKSITDCNVFVFTLGLTESWINSELDFEYPLCPGTVAGEFDGKIHKFKNQKFLFVYKNLLESIKLIKGLNQNVKILLTVSPVPLTATKSLNHVLVATMESKSVLRAVAGQLAEEREDVDYFPSYEIINSAVYRGMFFEPNQRNVNGNGVDFVMKNFFNCIYDKFGFPEGIKGENINSSTDSGKIICEEELLSAFGK